MRATASYCVWRKGLAGFALGFLWFLHTGILDICIGFPSVFLNFPSGKFRKTLGKTYKSWETNYKPRKTLSQSLQGLSVSHSKCSVGFLNFLETVRRPRSASPRTVATARESLGAAPEVCNGLTRRGIRCTSVHPVRPVKSSSQSIQCKSGCGFLGLFNKML